MNGDTLQIFDSRLVDNVGGEAGVVAESSDDGILVSAGDNAGVLISRVRPAGEAKISAAQYAAASEIKVGDRLGS